MRILVFAPHNDDEVLGVGGTIRRHVLMGDSVFVCEVTSGPKYKMMQEQARLAHERLGVTEAVFLNLPVSQLADLPKTELNARIDEIVKRFSPDVVYTPFLGDMHFDHRMVTEAVLVATRPVNGCPVKKAYMYETLSETGWNAPYGSNNFSPNRYVDISDTLEDKLAAMACYTSQVHPFPHPRSAEAISALAMHRGAEAGKKYAESFMLIREID